VPQIARTPENEQAAFDRAVAMLERIHGMARSANGDYSRPNVLKQTRSFQDLENPVLLPGIKVNTRATNYHPIRAMQLARWNGHMWVRFGEVIEGGTTWWAASQWLPAQVSIQLPRPANPPPMTNALATTAPDCPPSTPKSFFGEVSQAVHGEIYSGIHYDIEYTNGNSARHTRWRLLKSAPATTC
jgi:hypothetical protein